MIIGIAQSRLHQVGKVVAGKGILRVGIGEVRKADVLKAFFINPARGKVSFPDQSRLVAGVPEMAGNVRCFAAVITNAVPRYAVALDEHSGQKGAPRRTANRIVAIGLVEADSGCCDFIEMKRPHIRVPCQTETVGVVLVGHQPKDVGALG